MADKNKTDSSSGLPKRSIVVRIFILIIAVLMFIGVIAFPFFASGIFG